jgi:acyl-CoA synthetase (AMP-forming)/AMP-acid ligase II
VIDSVPAHITGDGLAPRITDVLAVDPDAPAIEYEGSWSTWGDLADTARQAAALVDHGGAEVGIILRNRPASIGFLLGVLTAGGCVVTINPGRGRDRTRDDIASLDLAVLAGEADDLAELVSDGLRATRAAASALGQPMVITPGAAGPRIHTNPERPETAVRMLTSGTTGPPKRVDLSYRMLERVLVGAKHYESNRDETVHLRRGVAIVNSPLVHLGGLFRVLQCVTDGRSFCLLERFTVDAWSDAVRRHRPATASLVPAALRMVLEADLKAGDLSSIRSVVSGTAPLDADDADAFTAKYGIPVLITYAATEFGGSVAGWNLDDHKRFWAAKRGSVGRAHDGCELRAVDAESGAPVAPGVEGLLEVKARQLGHDSWVRTTDLARLDEDGFLFILGRADQAIIRGGFKVRPDDIKAALERHQAVRGAAVVSRVDRRLGAVPVAVVELRPGADPVSTEDLLRYLTGVLARYELPTEIHRMERLPRTESGKVDLFAVNAFLDSEPAER